MKYLVIVEKAKRGFSAYSPDLPGCIAAAATRREVESAMRKAVALHVSGLRAGGETIPPAQTYSTWVDVRG